MIKLFISERIHSSLQIGRFRVSCNLDISVTLTTGCYNFHIFLFILRIRYTQGVYPQSDGSIAMAQDESISMH